MKYFFIVSLFKLVLELPILRFLFPLHHPPATAIAFPEYNGGTERRSSSQQSQQQKVGNPPKMTFWVDLSFFFDPHMLVVSILLVGRVEPTTSPTFPSKSVSCEGPGSNHPILGFGMGIHWSWPRCGFPLLEKFGIT